MPLKKQVEDTFESYQEIFYAVRMYQMKVKANKKSLLM